MKTSSNNNNSKLQLRKERIRPLTARGLKLVAGGPGGTPWAQ
jgi:hypothetical protein